MKSLICSVSISVIFFCSALSQTNFVPGFIIDNQNDTTHGLIDYRGDTRNCKICVFKSELKAKPVTYEPHQIKAFRVNEYCNYKLELVHIQHILIFDRFYDGVNFDL